MWQSKNSLLDFIQSILTQVLGSEAWLELQCFLTKSGMSFVNLYKTFTKWQVLCCFEEKETASQVGDILYSKKNWPPLFFQVVFIFYFLLLCWVGGYIVAFTKVLTMHQICYTWIHPLQDVFKVNNEHVAITVVSKCKVCCFYHRSHILTVFV
jgi:hypothetical protein